jgi:hypothetical protein
LQRALLIHPKINISADVQSFRATGGDLTQYDKWLGNTDEGSLLRTPLSDRDNANQSIGINHTYHVNAIEIRESPKGEGTE